MEKDQFISILLAKNKGIKHLFVPGQLAKWGRRHWRSNSTQFQKAGTAVRRLRPALVSGSIRMRTKMQLRETFLESKLLYGLETAVIRKCDFEKLNTVLSKARRMIPKLDSKRSITNVQIPEKAQLITLDVKMAVRRANLWVSPMRLQVEASCTKGTGSGQKSGHRKAMLLDKEKWLQDPKPLK